MFYLFIKTVILTIGSGLKFFNYFTRKTIFIFSIVVRYKRIFKEVSHPDAKVEGSLFKTTPRRSSCGYFSRIYSNLNMARVSVKYSETFER